MTKKNQTLENLNQRTRLRPGQQDKEKKTQHKAQDPPTVQRTLNRETN